MAGNSYKSGEVFEGLARVQRGSLVLSRRARVSALFALFFAGFAGLFLLAGGLALWMDGTSNPQYLGVPTELTLRAQEVEALKQSGRGIGVMIMASMGLAFMFTAIGFGRKWARAASESIAGSDAENRMLLQEARGSELAFALFLRGFEAEGKSIQSMFFIPLPNGRVTKATRWIESEVVDELRKNKATAFCIANPSDDYLLPGAFRLVAQRGNWLSEISALAAESDTVIVHVSALSEGLLAELNLLIREGLTNKCVLIVNSKLLKQKQSLIEDFPLLVSGPPMSLWNSSAFGPIVGKLRFRRELRGAIRGILQEPRI